MDRGDKEERSVDLYITAETVRDLKHKKEVEESNTTITKPAEHTGSERVMNRSYRSVTVCLVLMCVLLLTAVIVLRVLINTNNQQFNIKNKNITEERDQLLLNYKNLTTENGILLTDLNKQREQLNATMEILLADEWIYYQYSCYFISSELKSWTESRRYCIEKGADLIIINNKEEQDYFEDNFGQDCWIGLSDSDEEDKWNWVDGSTLNSSFWDNSSAKAEPNGGTEENCAATYLQGWADYSCTDRVFKCVCEKNFF